MFTHVSPDYVRVIMLEREREADRQRFVAIARAARAARAAAASGAGDKRSRPTLSSIVDALLGRTATTSTCQAC